MSSSVCGFSGVSVWMPELQQLFGLYSMYWLRIILNTGSSVAPQWIALVNKRYVEWKKKYWFIYFYFFTCCGVVLWCTGLFPKPHHNILVSLPTFQTHIWFKFTPILSENLLAESSNKVFPQTSSYNLFLLTLVNILNANPVQTLPNVLNCQSFSCELKCCLQFRLDWSHFQCRDVSKQLPYLMLMRYHYLTQT